MTSNEMDLEKIFLILRMHVRLIAAVFLLGVLMAVIVTYQMPKMYRATTSLNFEFNSTNPLDDRESRVLAQDSYITTQVSILKSLSVAQRIVDGLSDYERQRLRDALDAKASVIDDFKYGLKQFTSSLFMSEDSDSSNADNSEWSGDTLRVGKSYDGLAKWIGVDLEITPLINSRIVEVSYYSTNPGIAAFMANRVSEAYIATNLKMVTDPAYSKKIWFDEQLKSLRASLEESQARLTAYQQQEGIVSSGERIDLETSRLQNLADQLVKAQEVTRNAETTLQKLNDVLSSGASLMTFEPVFNNTVVQKVKVEIRDLEGRLVESSSSLGENHPRIVKLKSESRAARNRLNREIQSITDGIVNTADLAKQREKDLAQAMEEQKTLVLSVKGEHDRIAVLQREVESARATYNAALNQLNTTSMLSMVSQTNVSIVDHATVPSRPATPNVAKNLAVGAFGGLLLGVGIALFMGVFVRRIHSEEDLVNGIGIPLLGHLK
ncbi:MAG TPA: hypothetical protein ENI68_12335 [Gammaproteobacteria bacterium]|nr:hypothetical protein [Gammaproteobacteria bacterium]